VEERQEAQPLRIVVTDGGITDIEPVEPRVEVRVVTAHSVWLLQPGRFCRLPRGETPRDVDLLVGVVDDGQWVEMRSACWCVHGGTLRVRVVPADRPPTARGLISSSVAAWSGE